MARGLAVGIKDNRKHTARYFAPMSTFGYGSGQVPAVEMSFQSILIDVRYPLSRH